MPERTAATPARRSKADAEFEYLKRNLSLGRRRGAGQHQCSRLAKMRRGNRGKPATGPGNWGEPATGPGNHRAATGGAGRLNGPDAGAQRRATTRECQPPEKPLQASRQLAESNRATHLRNLRCPHRFGSAEPPQDRTADGAKSYQPVMERLWIAAFFTACAPILHGACAPLTWLLRSSAMGSHNAAPSQPQFSSAFPPPLNHAPPAKRPSAYLRFLKKRGILPAQLPRNRENSNQQMPQPQGFHEPHQPTPHNQSGSAPASGCCRPTPTPRCRGPEP